MTPERWQQVKQIFHAALEREPAVRSVFLGEACGTDRALRSEVESLISSHEEDGSFIDSPAFGTNAGLLADDALALETGARLGVYEIVVPLGAGGMGEVYLASDHRLGRRVALKILPEAFTSKTDRLRRFEQEARAASALNHPNIITIYEIGEADGAHFIATEYIEGETLRRHLRRAHAGVDESLRVAIQIADALSAAHKAGIIHRDIKPENVMLRPDGYVKVLDFGLAKLAERAAGDSDPEAPTRALVNTNPGVVMGTAQYMSPEQARGLEVDARTDIFSLGVVLYEMIAGREPFGGETATDTLSNILQKEPPPLARFAAGVPPELERIVAKALRKDREERYQVVKDLLLDLKSLKQELEFAAMRERAGVATELRHTGQTDDVSQPRIGSHANETRLASHAQTADSEHASLQTHEPASRTNENRTAEMTTGVAPQMRAARTRRIGVAALVALCLVAIAAAGFYKFVLPRLQRPAHFAATRITQITNTGKTIDVAVSPDGKYAAYVVIDAGQQSLWVKQLGVANDRQIVAPARVGYWGITFSPDGSEIYYAVKASDAGTLYRIPVLGGSPVKLAVAPIDSTITFSPDGKRIAYFVGDERKSNSELVVADPDGKNQRALYTRKLPEFLVPVFYAGPSWSPDGRTIACAVARVNGLSKVVSVNVEDGSEQTLAAQPWTFIGRVQWLPDMSGLLIIARSPEVINMQIWFVPYPAGEPRRVTNDLDSYRSITLTTDGKQLASVSQHDLSSVWVAPEGDAARATELPTGNVGWMGHNESMATLPDGRLVYSSFQTGKPGIWVMNADGSDRRLLTPEQIGFDPAATPDGRYVVYTTFSGDKRNVWRMKADGSDAVRLTDGEAEFAPSVSPDSRWVVYESLTQGKLTLWKVSIDGGEARQLTDKVAYEPQVSPDGKWIAYGYSEFTNTEFVYNAHLTKIAVMPFDGGEPVKVFDIKQSNSIQSTLRWSADSRALLYTVATGTVSNIWSQPLDGGAPKQMTNFTDKLITTFFWTRDNRLYCARAVLLRDADLISDAK
jgi:serine/threonine protein kinase/Tol biopolymer transport system component